MKDNSFLYFLMMVVVALFVLLYKDHTEFYLQGVKQGYEDGFSDGMREGINGTLHQLSEDSILFRDSVPEEWVKYMQSEVPDHYEINY